APLPTEMSAEAKDSMANGDKRLDPLTRVMGVEIGAETKAYPLHDEIERACYDDAVANEPVAVFWYGPTKSAIAFSRKLDDRTLNFYADDISPETAPFKDKETETRWSIAGRGIDGPLKGKELHWVNSIQCRWYAWSGEYPDTQLYEPPK
ncbi:DUF3179 domain-containing protein, partial [Candidatus Sumerlaeota bacterium]|nr:DUF3179 domain-containing protein [Candidatus Sumerlaeota bacterium]